MRKETIIQYEKEFIAWCKGDSVLKGFPTSMSDRTLIWQPVTDFTDWRALDTTFIIDNEYAIFAKALAEGKTVQFQDITEAFNDLVTTPRFDQPIKCYRIKPEEPQFKEGDFVRDLKNNKVYRISDFCNIKLKYLAEDKHANGIQLSEVNLLNWKPQDGELCWFRNSKWSKPEESIVIKYTKDLEKNYDLIEPYIEGKLPTWIKE